MFGRRIRRAKRGALSSLNGIKNKGMMRTMWDEPGRRVEILRFGGERRRVLEKFPAQFKRDKNKAVNALRRRKWLQG